MAHLSGLGTLAQSYRWAIFGIVALVAAAAGTGLTQLKFDRDPRVYFGEQTDDRVQFDTFEEDFGRINSAVYVVTREDEGDLGVEGLEVLRRISIGVRDIAGAVKVNSVVDEPLIRRTEGTGQAQTVKVISLREITNPSKADYEEALKQIRDNPDKFDKLFSKDGEAALVSVTMQMPGEDDALFNDSIDRIKDLASDTAEDFDDYKIVLTGDSLLPSNFDAAFKNDLRTLMPMQFGLMFLFLFVCYRSVGATLATITLIIVSIVTTMGVAGWFGLVLNGVSAGTASVLNGLAVATCVHVVFAWQDGCRAGDPSLLALGKSMRSNFKPVVLALITTVASFLSLNFSDSPPFRHLGNLVALGLVVVLILSFTLLPALLSLLPPPKPREAEGLMDGFMKALSRFVARNHVAINGIGVVVAAASIFGLGSIVFDDRFSKYFDDRFEFRQATDVYEDKFSGIGSIHYAIKQTSGKPVDSKAYLETLAEFDAWLKDQEEVTGTSSVLDLYRSVAKGAPNLADDRGVPTSEQAAEQLKKLVDERVAESDRKLLYSKAGDQTRLTVFFGKISSRGILDFKEKADKRFKKIDHDLSTPATGMSILAGLLSSRNIDGMIVGTLLSLLLVSVVMVFSLGKISYGFVSLVPNVMPVLLAYGLWGVFIGDVSFAGAMVCAMTFGIVVDDTVHFMNKYRYLREIRLLNPDEALAEVFRTVGWAIIVTSFAIGLGFLALAMSGFLVNRDLGLLTAMTIFAALIADLFFLPALLYLLERGKKVDKASKSQTIGRTKIHLPETGAAFLVDVDRPSIILPIKGSVAKVGRHPENDVIVSDPTVHRYHATLTKGLGKAYHLQDLSPPHGNGIWVNGKRAKEADIVPGDLIELGEVRMRYVSA